MAKRVVEGFDYTTQKKIKIPYKEAQDLISKTIVSGGHRRAEYGETFLHGKDGKITHEFYSYVSQD